MLAIEDTTNFKSNEKGLRMIHLKNPVQKPPNNLAYRNIGFQKKLEAGPLLLTCTAPGLRSRRPSRNVPGQT